MKSKEELELQLSGLVDYCQKTPVPIGMRPWIEGQIYTLLWTLGTPTYEANQKSQEITNPIKAVCPPPTV